MTDVSGLLARAAHCAAELAAARKRRMDGIDEKVADPVRREALVRAVIDAEVAYHDALVALRAADSSRFEEHLRHIVETSQRAA